MKEEKKYKVIDRVYKMVGKDEYIKNLQENIEYWKKEQTLVMERAEKRVKKIQKDNIDKLQKQIDEASNEESKDQVTGR